MSYNEVIPWSGFAASPWGRSGGVAPFDQLLFGDESATKGFSIWRSEMVETAYVYELTDTETGMWYVGSRTAQKCHPSDLGVKYFTSSKVVGPLFRSNPGRFDKKIIVISDGDYIVKVETSILKFRDAKNDPVSYNLHNGDGVFNHSKTGKRVAADNQRLGKAIFAQTLEQRRAAGRNGGKLAGPKGGKTQGDLNAKNGVLIKARAAINWDNVTRVNGGRLLARSFEERSAVSKIASAKNWKCACCDLKGSAGTMGMHQKASGHIGKEKLNVQS